MKKLFIVFITTILLISCESKNLDISKDINQTEKTIITTSIIPLASLVNTIGGNNIEVKNIVGAGKSPHNFELKTSHITDLEKAKGIIIIGLEHIDGFLDKVLNNKNILKVSEGINLLEMGVHEHEEEVEHSDKKYKDDNYGDTEINSELHKNHQYEKDEHQHRLHEKDPHIWNSPENTKIIAGKIKDFLNKLQVKNKEIFEKNYKDFIIKIDILIKNFKTKTHLKKQNYFIVFHDAYNYLLRDLGLDENKKLVFRKSVLNEPNSQDMKKIIDEIQEHKIKIAFIEPQFKNTNFEKITKKYGIKTYVLDPLGNDENADGFLKNLENNLASLEKIFE